MIDIHITEWRWLYNGYMASGHHKVRMEDATNALATILFSRHTLKRLDWVDQADVIKGLT